MEVLFVQLMNPTILCGQMEMQALQLAYVSILLCLFLNVENSLPRRKAFHPCKSSCGTFSPQNNWLQLIRHRSRKVTSKCFMHVDRPNLCLSACAYPCAWVGSGWEFYELQQAAHACLRDIRKTIWKKYFIFINVYSTCVGETPRLYSCLHHVAACIYITILLVIFTQALLANIHTKRKHFS